MVNDEHHLARSVREKTLLSGRWCHAPFTEQFNFDGVVVGHLAAITIYAFGNTYMEGPTHAKP